MELRVNESGHTLLLATHSVSLTDFRLALLTWWKVDGRNFPWRSATSPFHILMAEMMLRRTQARQVVSVYTKFVEQYPTVQALAGAPANQVSSSLRSLGLSWRIPAFQQLANVLISKFGGDVPADYGMLVELPGVGDYVAAAVCCFAFNQPHIIADTNTVRVIGRICGVPIHEESRRRKPIRRLLEIFLDSTYPREYNYGLLDLAASICTPSEPRCSTCPVVTHCKTGQARLEDLRQLS